ncbi:RimK family alpha-L-glutamate ligase [Vulgatibacter sp.]|uniref:RimK family alpha-L-glutamate ligase n=1 Tax=Vulgatibacter sp. TaxID=1971226 RepID=UPI0035699B36
MVRFGIISAYASEDASSQGLIEACERLGEAVAIDPATLSVAVRDGSAEVHCARIPAADFDALLLVRGIGRKGDPDLQFEIYRALEMAGAPIMNRLDGLLAAQDKFRTSLLLASAGIATPEVQVVQRSEDAAAALRALGTAVAKPMWGSLGDGIELLRDDASGRRRAEALFEERAALYLQRYVDHGGRDVRAFVVGGRVEAAMERIAPPGEFRTNVSIGAEPRAIELPPEAEAMAVRAARALGLDWAGVDLAFGPSGPTVIEVNGSPNWEGIFRATGRDMAEAIAHHAARRAHARLTVVAAPIEGMGG